MKPAVVNNSTTNKPPNTRAILQRDEAAFFISSAKNRTASPYPCGIANNIAGSLRTPTKPPTTLQETSVSLRNRQKDCRKSPYPYDDNLGANKVRRKKTIIINKY